MCAGKKNSLTIDQWFDYCDAIFEKLPWRQWQDVLDIAIRQEDKRIFKWVVKRNKKIRADDWREFEKGLRLYLKNKDTSVFTDEELFEIYDSIMEMGQYWRIAFLQFSKDFPNSAKIKTKARRSKKYQSACFKISHEQRKTMDDEIFSKAFEAAMK